TTYSGPGPFPSPHGGAACPLSRLTYACWDRPCGRCLQLPPYPGREEFMSRHRPRPTRRAVLRLEALEGRDVPSCTASLNPATGTLTVTGTKRSDAIVIQDDGTNNAGAVTVRCGATTLFTSGPTAGVDQVHSVVVHTRNGKDRVSYDLTGTLASNARS